MTPTRKLWVVARLHARCRGRARQLLAVKSRAGLPAQGSEAYEQTTRQFYRGLAGLQVGLIDAARQEFVQATELAPGEPAVVGQSGTGAPAAR